MNRLAITALGILLGTSLNGGAFWGIEGHQVVARIAAGRLSAHTSQEVARLLGGQSLADVSNWADEIKAKQRRTASWHYINVSILDSAYVRSRDCRNGGCIIEALQQQVTILSDARRTKAARANALKWVIHLVADLHQPLHVGTRGDRGGNDVRVRLARRATNLHAAWDSGILTSMGITEDSLVLSLTERLKTRADTAVIASGTIVSWAMESLRASRDVVYRFLPADLALNQSYLEQARPVVEEQLMRGGVRLAAVLERALAPVRR